MKTDDATKEPAMTSNVARLDRNFEIPNVQQPMDWYDLAALPTEGQGWPDETPGRFGRLPARAQGVVREPVWDLGKHAAGLTVRFVTDSQSLAASWDIVNAHTAMAHMPSTGVSGIDFYVWADNRWRWCGIAIPEGFTGSCTFTKLVTADLKPGKRQFMACLPLYNVISGVRIGVTPGSVFEAAPQRPEADRKPLCFYGTSILQGGCASRPGMAYPSIISRYLNLPHINLGFSGNARMEPEIASLLAELDPVAYVLDPLPNNTHQDVTQRASHLVQTIRDARPDTPIIMVENIIYQQGHIHTQRHDRYTNSNKAWRKIFDQHVASGDAHLHYIPCDDLLGDDDEATVDGTHATDLGFWRMAQAITPTVRKVLGR